MKNNYKITDFPEGTKILFNDGEEWIVVKKGMRGSGSFRKSDEITIKPFNKLAKDKNVSLPIDINLGYLNSNVKEINESEVNESNHIKVGTFVRYKKDKDFTGGKVKSIKGGNVEIHNWDGSTTELPIKDLEYVKSWNESEVNERNTKLYVYPSSKKDHQMISNWLDRSAFHAEEDSNSFMFPVSGQRDADATEKELDKEFEKLGANARFVLEGRSQIKRKYGEYGAIRVNSEAPIRNSILEFVGKRFVTKEELNSHLTQLSEDRGKAIDQTKWFSRNMKYFESFQNRGQQVWTLSKYGKRVLENILKTKQEKQMINESIGLFKFSLVNESFNAKYWEDYHDSGESGKIKNPNNIQIQQEVEATAEEWNDNNENGPDNEITPKIEKKVIELAKKFVKAKGWISTDVIEAMLAQEA
jgi:hypothetical protein